MNIRVKAVTTEKDNVNLENILTFAGKQAGICYMPDTYEALDRNTAGALKRISGCMSSGHHSVIEHCYVTVLFENVSKLFAMLLNSLQVYNTSEKSGRYTIMQSAEVGLYGKWLNIFVDLYEKDLRNRGVSADKCEKLGKKMAQDSARGVISVLAHNTTFGYTTSVRIWNYIRSKAVRFIAEVSDNVISSLSSNSVAELKAELQELVTFIDNTMKVEKLDTEDSFDFITNFSTDSQCYSELGENYRNWGIQYLATYRVSFITLAQLERHRTLKFHMTIPTQTITYSVPNIIQGTEYEEVWLKDLATVELPQAMQVLVMEQGNVDAFVMKCRERICGAAHEETRAHTVGMLKEYYKYSCESGVEQRIVKNKLASCMEYDSKRCVVRQKVKCKKGYKCTNPCIYKTDVENL